MSRKRESIISYAAILLAVCSLSVFAFLFAYYKDNKYTVRQPQGKDGVLRLDDAALKANPVIFLISGWEYYGGRLLSPGDFALNAPRPDQYIYIGQYGGFEAGDPGASPHGSATYRLSIITPARPREYTLELPEIFSAYRAYINGDAVIQMGDPDPASYHPRTGNRSVTFQAGGRVEIIIAASDFSRLYSGMTYPPSFGEPESIANLISSRLVIRGAVCAVALTIALLSSLIGLLSRDGLTALYSLLCFFFIGYVSYPLIQTYGAGYQPFYVIENLSFCAMLLLTMWLTRGLLGFTDRWSRFFLAFGAICCAFAIALPIVVSLGNAGVLYGYSRLISLYQWIAAFYITFVTGRAVIKNNVRGLAALCGVLAFDCALVMDRLLPLYEPIRAGWFIEAASFALVIAIGASIGLEVAAKYRENAALTERAAGMERLSGMQQGYFTALRREMDETKAARHDLRHHFMVMDGLSRDRKYDELSAYIAQYSGGVHTNEPRIYSGNNVINIMIHHYNALCERNHILLDARCEIDDTFGVSDADLCGLLSNLLENAVEACLRIKTGRRVIRLGFTRVGDDMVIRVENTTDADVTPIGEGGAFQSSKSPGRIGYGLASVRAIVKRYDGAVTFSWDKEKRLFTSVVVL